MTRKKSKKRKEGDNVRCWLKNLRAEKGYTQTVVAEKLGIKQNYYSAIETGERQKDLDLSIMERLSNLFGVSIEWIAEQERNKG